MKNGRMIWIGVPAAVLVACLAGSFATRRVMSELPSLHLPGQGSREAGVVDQQPFLTAQALAGMAVSSEEQALAREAERLADHEVDQAFAQALRQADMTTRQLTGPALAIQKKIDLLASLVKEDQAQVDSLTAAAKKGGAAQEAAAGDSLDVAKAQLQLDTDELNDANADLARASGDRRDEIQQELTARQQSMQKYDTEMAQGGQTAVVAERRFGTLAGRIQGWFAQRDRMALLAQARQQAAEDVARFEQQHGEMERTSAAAGAKLGAADGATTATASDAAHTRVQRLAQMHQMVQISSILDDRIATEQQLVAVYGKWIAQVQLQHEILLHLLLQSIAGVAAIVLAGMVAWWVIKRLLERLRMDARTLHTLETVTRLGLQIVVLIAILLMLFGAPDHTPTILGLATAGLTVVFQDFILAFFGWFVLMGRNGIRVGDWVEINGVGGEVTEIGLFRTTLMETGNWTDKGHPTGRRVTFINNFAITGQYFNFSTAGQWMWDEISVNVPAGENSYKTIAAIQEAVQAHTEKDTSEAETEWKTATKQRGLSQFSAKPTVNVRPAASGTEVVVRYVTRAAERFERRNSLYTTLVDVLEDPSRTGKAHAV